MECIINLYDTNQEFEIVTDVDDGLIHKLNKYISEKNKDSEKLIVELIENFVESNNL